MHGMVCSKGFKCSCLPAIVCQLHMSMHSGCKLGSAYLTTAVSVARRCLQQRGLREVYEDVSLRIASASGNPQDVFNQVWRWHAWSRIQDTCCQNLVHQQHISIIGPCVVRSMPVYLFCLAAGIPRSRA